MAQHQVCPEEHTISALDQPIHNGFADRHIQVEALHSLRDQPSYIRCIRLRTDDDLSKGPRCSFGDEVNRRPWPADKHDFCISRQLLDDGIG